MALRKNIRSTGKQIQSLVEYMSTHSSFANGEFYGPMGRRAYNEEWVRLQHLMRNYGPDKTVEQWRMTWRDLKKKARIDGSRHKEALAKENEFVPDISETSQKVLEIIGWDSISGIGLEETGLNDFSLLPVASPPPSAQTHSKPHHTPSNSLAEPSTSRVQRTGAKGQVSDDETWEAHQISEGSEPSEYIINYDGDNDDNDDNDSTQEDPIKYEDQDPLSKAYENTEASGSTPVPRKRKMFQMDSSCNTVRLVKDSKNDVKPVMFLESPKIRRIAPKSTEKYMPRDHTYHANVPRDGAVAKLKQDDEFDTFGKHIANQLRKLSTLKYILAQEEIQCTVTKFRMEDFNR